MRAGRVQYNRGDKGPRNIMSVAISIVIGFIGFLLCQPFFWTVIIGGQNFHYISIPVLMMIMGCIVGLPMFFAGIIGFFMGGKSNASASTYNDHDLSRIRHAVEMEKMKGK